MPSVDIVSEIDLQELDNAVNQTKKEVETRYDFRGANTEIELNKKDKVINLVTGDDMKVRALKDMLITSCTRRKVDPAFLEFGEVEPTSGGAVKQTVTLNEGISKDDAKKITKLIKDSKLKVQAQIQDEQVRVTGKKIDDLQAVMTMCREQIDLPLQFTNMKK